MINDKIQFTEDKIKQDKLNAKQEKALGTNPSAQLDKDAFLKLLLVELQYQDPTSPMDTEKMLSQTSQLATLESQENANTAIRELVGQLKNNSSMFAMSALGKMANLGTDKIEIKEGNEGANVDIPLYFKNSAKSGLLEVLDDKNNVVKNIDIKDLNSGLKVFKWDSKDNEGKALKPGSYTIRATYKSKDGDSHSVSYGRYPVEAVKFIEGKAQVKIAGEYVPIDKISEFFE